MARARIGIVGLGTFGLNHLRTFRQLSWRGECELVAGCDINEQTLEQRLKEFQFAPYTDYREMLAKERLDAVTVVTPDAYHREIVLAAAEAGVHVLCEKPLDVTVEGCLEMIEACQRAGVLLQVDFHKRYDEYHVAMKQKIDAGDLGTIQYGYAHMEDRLEVPRDWFPGWAKTSSPAWFLGIHFYDLARWLMSANGKRVWAAGRKQHLVELGIDTFDSITAMVEFTNGATVCFDTSWILPEGFPAIVNQGIRLVGTKGALECDSQDRGTWTFCTDDQPPAQTHNKSFLRLRYDRQGREIWEGYGIESIADFCYNVNHLLDGANLADLGGYASGYDGLEATKIAAAVHESINTGRLVEIA
jgi:predicted dehydrogenase